MKVDYQIPEPFVFNPGKHHLGFIKEFINRNINSSGTDIQKLTSELKHLGTSVMDIYSGLLSLNDLFREAMEYLARNDLSNIHAYSEWVGTDEDSFRIITLTDDSQWTLKFHDDPLRYVHIFPARNSVHTFRVKANTLKSALIYNIIVGKDLVTGRDLNQVRPLLGLSPVKNSSDVYAILEMIEILRA